MSDEINLLQEIDEALRADKAMQFWKSYGKWVLAGCVTVVALVAVSAFWNNYLNEQNMRETHVLIQADELVKHEKYDEASKLIESWSEWSEHHVTLAKLVNGQIYAKAGKREKAIELFKEVAASIRPEEAALRDSALLRLHALTGEVLPASAEADGAVFALRAKEIKAAQLLEAGKKKEAADVLQSILVSAPNYSSERDRARELLREQAAVGAAQ